MRRLLGVFIAIVAVAGWPAGAADQGTTAGDAQLAAARHKATVDGDLKAAIEMYRQIVNGAGANRALAAQALLGMAECHQKLGADEARRIYEHVLQKYGDQVQAAAIARERLGSQPDWKSVRTSPGVSLSALPRSNVLPGTVSRDGHYMTFASWTDGNLYARDLQTGADRQLTQRNDFLVGVSAVSRDATHVAFETSGFGCDGKDRGPALCLVSMAGKDVPVPRALVKRDDIREIAPMDWSPDGRTIAVLLRREDRTAQIGLVTVADGSVRVLKTVEWRGPTRIVFSPDGRDLAFDLPVGEVGENRDIMMVAVDGSRGLPIVEHPAQDIVMGWTPDGSELLFASERGGTMALWAQAVSARRPQGEPRLIRDIGGAWALGVTRAGALYFGVRRNDRDISITAIDMETGKQAAAPVRPIRRFVGTNLFPDWSKDGRFLAYVSQRGFNLTNNNGRLIGIRDMTTGEERELHPRLLYFGSVSWSPDRKALLTTGTDIKGRSGVFQIDTQSADVSLVVEGPLNTYAQWSPDGKRVFYRKLLSSALTDASVVERDLSSGTERVIFTGEFAVFSVSPDGGSIVVPTGDFLNGTAAILMQISVGSSETRELLRAGPSERVPAYIAPRWTPDGRAVLVRKREPNELWLVPVTAEAPRKLEVDVREWSFGVVGQISVHPDGRQIAFLSGALANEVMVLENFLPAKSVR